MASCERCGADVEHKNAAGHYRDKCRDCIQDVASETPTHREQCEDDDCIVCDTP